MYACELAAFDGTDLEDGRPFEEVERFIRSIAAGSVVDRARCVTVRRARAGTASSVAAGSVGATPDAPVDDPSRRRPGTVATAAHELAHALAGVGHGHDAVYRRAYLDVVAMITNLDPLDRRGDIHVDQLADAFAAAGLTVGRASVAAARRRHGGSHRAVSRCIRLRAGPARRVSRLRAGRVRDVAQLG